MASSEISESDREALGALIARYAGRDSFLAKGIEIGWAAARERYALKPELADRSPEPVDRREWTLSPLNRQTVVLRRDSFGKWVTGSGLSESVVVVPKSRLESAMAAADEREATLKRVEAERDLAVAEAEESEGERCRGVMVRREREREAAREVRALTEALREIGAAASDFDHRTGEAMWANFGRFAHKHALAALPEKPAE